MLEDQIPVSELRDMYVRGNLRQRYSVALARIENPDHGPNQVVAAVAALEGFSRAVAVRAAVTSGAAVDDAYSRLRLTKPLDLIEKHVLPALQTTAAEAFDQASWLLVPAAIEFRNLLVHEATYLNGGTCQQLVEATVHVFNRIAELAGARDVAAG